MLGSIHNTSNCVVLDDVNAKLLGPGEVRDRLNDDYPVDWVILSLLPVIDAGTSNFAVRLSGTLTPRVASVPHEGAPGLALRDSDSFFPRWSPPRIDLNPMTDGWNVYGATTTLPQLDITAAR